MSINCSFISLLQKLYSILNRSPFLSWLQCAFRTGGAAAEADGPAGGAAEAPFRDEGTPA